MISRPRYFRGPFNDVPLYILRRPTWYPPSKVKTSVSIFRFPTHVTRQFHRPPIPLFPDEIMSILILFRVMQLRYFITYVLFPYLAQSHKDPLTELQTAVPCTS